MKKFIVYDYAFDPTARTIDFAPIAGFDLRRLVAVINQTDGITIYSTSSLTKGYTAFDGVSVLTLQYDTSAMGASDVLQVIYEDTGDETELVAIQSIDNKIPIRGSQPLAAAMPVATPQKLNSDTGPFSTINTDLITGGINGWYDARDYNVLTCQIIGSAGIAAGAVTFEGTNDNSVSAGQSIPYLELANIQTAPTVGATTIAASSARVYQLAINCRYIRLRISTGFTGGTVSMKALFSQYAYSSPVISAVVSGSVNATINGASNGIGVALQTYLNTEISSSAITSTTTTAASSIAHAQSLSFAVVVTAVSGTNPTLDISIQESADSGTNWVKRYDFQRITATGIWRSPEMNFPGINRIRFVQTISGTTPSFTRSVLRHSSMIATNFVRQAYDRTIVPTTLNSTTPALFVNDCSKYQLVVNTGASTTPTTYTLEGSMDGSNWFEMGLDVVASANTTVFDYDQSFCVDWIRAKVKSAGTVVTLGYVLLRATS